MDTSVTTGFIGGCVSVHIGTPRGPSTAVLGTKTVPKSSVRRCVGPGIIGRLTQSFES